MQGTTRLTIKDIELTPDGILIKSMNVIDGDTGETLRVAKLTLELVEFLRITEIDVTKYFQVLAMKKKNPEMKNLIDTFKLFT